MVEQNINVCSIINQLSPKIRKYMYQSINGLCLSEVELYRNLFIFQYKITIK